jgi:hypothetical protein
MHKPHARTDQQASSQEELLSGDRDLDVYAVRHLTLFQVRRAGQVVLADIF